MLYAFTENFILPYSHDEVVHGKRSMIDKMPGDAWQKAATLRALYTFMTAHPGKKLLFMGCEFGQWREWDHDQQLDWYLLHYGEHVGVQNLVRDLNRLYRDYPALHRLDGRAEGFQWLIGDDQRNSVFAWLRHAEGERPLLAVQNYTPVPRGDYRVGVPIAGSWRVLLNSDDERYLGSAAGSRGQVHTIAHSDHGQPQSLPLDLPPLGALILVAEQG
jgi:1,4-alpha-glucan branching enzyme